MENRLEQDVLVDRVPLRDRHGPALQAEQGRAERKFYRWGACGCLSLEAGLYSENQCWVNRVSANVSRIIVSSLNQSGWDMCTKGRPYFPLSTAASPESQKMHGTEGVGANPVERPAIIGASGFEEHPGGLLLADNLAGNPQRRQMPGRWR